MASFAPPPLAASRPLPINAAVAAATAPVPAHAPAQTKKKSKLPLVLGILAVLLVLGLGGLGAAYWFVVRPMLEKSREVRNDNTEPARQPTPTAANTPNETAPPKTENVKEVPPYSPPADAVQFVNSRTGSTETRRALRRLLVLLPETLAEGS
jgi:cytoskeletal protein RodZ